jgi:hypothetical protein
MLAYIFWHMPHSGVEPTAYERNLVAFARTFADVRCPGVQGVASFRIAPVAWLAGQNQYEDWTIVEGAQALEGVNESAVTGSMAAVHAAVAQQMARGYGGLYYHLWGDLDPFDGSQAQWITRPRGIEFRPVLRRLTDIGMPVSVWRRFMVLGPGTEFLVVTREGVRFSLPANWSSHGTQRTRLA